jgi:hypothetical protein
VFSGFSFAGAYEDIYLFTKEVERWGNVSIQEVIKRHKKGGGEDKPAFYFDFINTIGLVPAAMLIGAITEDNSKYQSTKAARLLAESFKKYSLTDEMIVRGGLQGVRASLERRNVEIEPELMDDWSTRLEEMSRS